MGGGGVWGVEMKVYLVLNELDGYFYFYLTSSFPHTREWKLISIC